MVITRYMPKRTNTKNFHKTVIKVKRSSNEENFITSLLECAKKLKIKGPVDLSVNLDKYLYGGKEKNL